MDINKQRLKNRLNVKFEPLKMHPASMKKLAIVDKITKQFSKDNDNHREKDASVLQSSRNRSITHVRLPSLDKKSNVIRKIEEKTEEIINIRQMRQRIKSIKVLPTIKVESKEPINDTITYLMKNQILNIPKIVAMLQKSQSEEFLYMKVIGIYEFEVCNEQEKGSHYITVSKNGMVRDGELTPLDKLIYQYEIFNKLKKNPFFRYYLAIKFMNKWHKGSKMIKFVQNKFKIKKLLFLDNEKILGWKVELKGMLFITDKGGHVNSGWVNKVAKEIESNKVVVENKLLHISVKLLQKFQLPISESFELMNKVLSSLLTLNINFQKKIRIQKELQLIYKMGMMLQFYELQSIAFYLINHIELISLKFEQKNNIYLNNILLPIEALNFNDPNYTSEKQKILLGTVLKEEINFKMYINQYDEIVVQPTMKSILSKIKSDIKEFISKVQNFDYKIIRIPKFDYVVKNVIKLHEIEQSGGASHQKETNLKEYIYSISAYYEKLNDLENNAEIVNQTIQRRIRLMEPFYRIYQNYREKFSSRVYLGFNYDQINEEIQEIEQNIEICQNKLHDGEYFLLGYLSQLEMKEQIIDFLKEYKENVLSTIPGKIRENKENFIKNMVMHLEVLRIFIKNADDFIRVHTECDELDDKIIIYTSDLTEIEKLQDLYLRVKKIESLSLVEEKGLLNELKMKSKNYKETKEHSFLLYKKELETYKKDLRTKVEAIVSSEVYYELSPNPVELYNKCHENNIKLNQLSEQLKHLNGLQAFFDIKTTLIPKLQTLLIKFESLQEIWQIYKELQVEKEAYYYTNIMKIEVLPLIKKYQFYTRKCERYKKDPDYYKLAQHLIEQIPLLLNSFYIIEDLHNPILRSIDYDEISQLFEKQFKIGRQVKDLPLSIVYESKLYNAREQVLQINFKSHKEQEIQRLLKEYDLWWKGIKLEGEYLDEYPLIIIFNDNDQLRKEIEQYSTILLNIINHKYGAFARRECNNNLRNINNLAGLLELAINHQQKFLSLFPILTSKYAQKQLPSEAKKFMTIIQKTMKNVKWLIRPTENLNEITKTLLNNHIKQFDSISKTLAHFLEKKRVKFQRFYFLQDDELLEVLVGIGAENTIFRMFEGIKGWLVDKQGVKYGVEGIGSENLILRGWSYKNQQPEIIFKSLQDSIRNNLNSIVRNILNSYQNELKQLKNLYPNMPWMCIYTVELILFTKQMEINCFQNGVGINMQESLIQENISASVANPLENSNYITLQLFLLHFTEQLRHENVASIFDFKWQSFLRYYYQKESVNMRIMGAEHGWGGEYQGMWNLMINTSDIRRAHTSILSNIKYGNGVLLQGPSGTGKTESLKELGRCMAKYCVIFNCSSQVNIRTLQKLLSGLCYTGSWLCLDQINRLTAEIMSVVANQINSIKNAVVQSKQIFSFMGKDMKLKKGVGIFSTMNPIYLKRAKLTQSLKSYFRIISVNVPDYEKILEVMLYSLGISSSSIYAHKISVMFKNLSIQLSLRSQYDFGLRAMKFFIFNLSLIRKSLKNQEQSIIEALCKTFYSRLEAYDKQSFSKIISDMFGKKLAEKQTNYKVAMMKEAPQTGIIVLGPTSSKTTLINEYIDLFQAQHRVVEIFNPNSLQLKYFLGQNILGRWEQGIVEKMARGSFENNNKNYVLVLDCKLKSQTIENFNTLLDDSKLLSLSNGTRLKIHDNFKIILETPDLQMTSPATITRCNVIYVSQSDINKADLVKRLLPIFSTPQIQDKMTDALSRFSINQIQRILKIAKLLFVKKLAIRQQLTESQSIGLEKCIFYTIQLLGKSEKVKQYLHKDNSIVSKKNIFNYYLNFSKYREGQFLQFEMNGKEMRYLSQVYIPTIRNKFYEYVNSRAYENCEYILWKGERMSGKSSCISSSLDEIFKTQPEQKNILKLTINPETNSKSISTFIEEKMNIKEEKDEHSKKLLVYVDDIHLGSEEIFEFFRFITEYQKLFSYKSKEIIELSRHTFIADSNNSYSKQFLSRFSRHFAEINLPPCEESFIKAIYTDLIRGTILQTKTSPDFKSSYELQMERVVNFFLEYLKYNNKCYRESFTEGSIQKQELEFLGYCDLLPIMRNFKILNDTFCKQVSDLIGFAFSELRSQEVQHRKSSKQIDFIKVSYNEVFKHKYQGQYDKNLKSITGHPLEVIKYSGIVKGFINTISNWEEYKMHILTKLNNNYYLSEFMLLEILKILRILEWNGGNYYLIGAPGVGRRTLLKISSFLAEKQCLQALPTDQKKISDWFFGIIKSSFERKRQCTTVLCLDNKSNFKVLSYLQKINNKYPIQQLFSNQNCQYAYSEINEYSEVNYDKYTKSYDEVISDFIFISKKKIQFLFYSSRAPVTEFMKNYHYLHQQTMFRLIDEVPSQSILQISNQILEKSINEEADKKGLTNLFLKIYHDLVSLMKENQNNQMFHFKYNPFYHFKIINRFIQNYKKLLEKAKEKQDILNRSILKVHQISQILEKLKIEIKQMEPKVKEKTQKLLEVVPILEAKKKVSQEVKVLVLNEKRQIENRNAQIEEMMKEVEEKISKAQPILQEANDSMLTLKRSQLSELRNNPNPHHLIKFTLENMVILLGENQSWESIKKLLSDPSLLTKLKNICPMISNIQKARKRIQQNKEWTFDNVSKVSFGVRYMVRWINNIIKFYELKNALDNQKQKVEQYKKELNRLEQKLVSKQRELDAHEDEIRIIEDEYNFNKSQLISLQQLININNRKFENAELIKNHLHEEINNWYDSLNQYKAIKKNSQGTSIYITLFLEIFNTLHLEEQLKIEEKVKEHFIKFSFSFDPNFEVFQYIKESIIRKKYVPLEKSKYKEENRQVFSLENLTIEDSNNPKNIQTLYHFQDRPILLDPDNQAINWIQRQLSAEGESDNKPMITKQSFLSSIKSVQTALREGQILILIIEDELDQFTNDILNAKITEASGSKIIEYNKNILHIHSNFRLLMCNKSRNPNLSNKLYIDYPILNFEITKNIMKTILLQKLITLQNKQIYEIRKQLEMQKKTNQKVISEVEEQIIESLINSKKTLIDDNQFINLLAENQAKRGALKENEADWKQKTINIKKIYDSYADITEVIGQMYLSLKYMSKINPLLSWNSEIFVQYFEQAVLLSISTPLFEEDDDDLHEVKVLKKSNFQFDHYSIGLGNSRPTSALSFMSGVTSKVSQQQRKDDFEEEHPISSHAFQNLIGYKQMNVDEKLRGTMMLQREKNIKNKFIGFVKFAFTEEERVIWGLILCFMDYPFKDIKNLIQIKAKRNKLKQYLDAGQLTDKIKNLVNQNQKFEEQLQKSFTMSNPFSRLTELSELQILLLCKLLYPSQFNNICKIMIKNKGFEQILNYSQIKTVNWFQRSDNVHPILLLMGEDPINRISQYLTKKRYKNVILIPMGEGQNKLAELVLERESKKQNLVIIHNLQISESFLVFLSKMLQQFQIKPPHENFRLILISTMFENLNEEITSYCHKYLIEQPTGIKNQIQYLRQINSIGLVHPFHKKLEFVLTYLHSIINNLSKYKPYGWNLKYEFHTTDFLNSIQTLKEVAESPLSLERFECNIDLQEEKAKLNPDEIDFKALRYMIGDIGYIGKLSDDIDRAKMNIIINQFISPNIFNSNQQGQLGIKGIKFSKFDVKNLEQIINTINQNDASIYGLHPLVKPISEYSHSILSKIAIVYNQDTDGSEDKIEGYLKPIEPINHKFQYINREISRYNLDLEKIKMEGATQALLKNLGNCLLLSTITPISKIFNLKSFSNPREFFIEIKKDVAQKNNVIYEKVELVWSLMPKQNLSGIYGISNIKLEGGSINLNHIHGCLDDGVEQKDLTLYVQAMIRKKDKDLKKLVSIPLYLQQERQGQINSYGDNTNMLILVKIDANFPQEFWILRSTAFVVK